MSPLLELLIKATLLLLAVTLLAALLPARLPALRHRLWHGALLGLLLLPATLWLPALVPIRLPVPAPAPTLVAEPQPQRQPPPIRTPDREPVPRPEPAPFPWAPVAAIVYGLGAAGLFLRLTADRRALRCLLADCQLVTHPLFDTIAAAFPARRRPTLWQTPEPIIPLATGRRVVLPEGALTWEPERLRVVLLHETVHIARRDPGIHLLAEVVRALWWFHPLVWWALARLHAEAELACDAQVLDSGVAPESYATYLLEVIQMLKRRPLAPNMARPHGLESRIQAILAYTPRPIGRFGLVALLGLTALAAPLVLARPVPQDTAPEKAQAEKKRLDEIEATRRAELDKRRYDEDKDRERALVQAKMAADLAEVKARRLDAQRSATNKRAAELAQRERQLDLEKLKADKLNAERLAVRQRQIDIQRLMVEEDLADLREKQRDLDRRLTDKQIELELQRASNGPDNPSIVQLQRQVELLTKMIERVREQRMMMRRELQAFLERNQ